MRRIAIGEGARTATIILGWPGPGLDSDDWAAMRVIDELLGTTGLRLEEALVDRQPLASSVDASFTDYTDAGFLAVFATTRPDAVDAVIDGILTEVRRLRDGDVSQAEITAMARAIVGRAEVGRDENLRQAITFAANDARGLIQSIDETQARLRALTPVDVQRVANLYLNPDAYTAVVVRS
jgi:zinc protease